MTTRPVILIGGGGHAGVVYETCLGAGIEVLGLLDDDAGCALGASGLEHLGPIGTPIPDHARYLVAIGDLDARRRVIERLDTQQACDAVAHPSAVVSPTATLGRGVVVLPGAVINRDARVGHHAIINTRSVVEHDCVVDGNAHLAPGSVLGGGVRVGAGTLVGIQAAALPGVRIGAGCVIGAGAVVTGDIGDHVRAAGVPARVMGAPVG